MAFSQLAGNCTLSAVPLPTIFGAEFLSIQTSLVHNYSIFVPESANPNHGDIYGKNLSFCNITLTHTHPGTNDTLTTQVWLPIQPLWNERLQAIGGGGWVAGLSPETNLQMSGAIAEGYATVSMNGGTPTNDPKDWALSSTGNVDLRALQNFASVSLNDGVLAAKSVIRSFYGRSQRFSYWSGCSQGGRQGLTFAQKYPQTFDGIAASAPGINWAAFFISALYPQQVMNEMETYPHPCELDALTAAAIKACDGQDGLVDGIISDPDHCQFDASGLVGTEIACNASSNPMSISETAVRVAHAAWNGSRATDGSLLWYTPGYEAVLTAPSGLAATTCSSNGTCTGQDLATFTDWIRLFVKKDPKFDVTTMTRRDYQRVFHASVREFDSIIGTSYPDLSEFRESGGKMITYHGLADSLLSYRNSRHYYDAITAIDPRIHDFYRLFESPGLAHCYGGVGGYPSGTFDALVKWVEDGVVPETLEARSVTNRTFTLCPYPSRMRRGAEGNACI